MVVLLVSTAYLDMLPQAKYLLVQIEDNSGEDHGDVEVVSKPSACPTCCPSCWLLQCKLPVCLERKTTIADDKCVKADGRCGWSVVLPCCPGLTCKFGKGGDFCREGDVEVTTIPFKCPSCCVDIPWCSELDAIKCMMPVCQPTPPPTITNQ